MPVYHSAWRDDCSIERMVDVPRWLEVVLVALGIVMAIGMIVAVPLLVVRLPANYFVRGHRRGNPAMAVLRNVLGGILVLLGIAMLVLPGQGVLTILLGVSLVDLPIKDRALKWILERKKIRGAIQGMRAKYGRAPLLIPA
jgi:hypothetical protein